MAAVLQPSPSAAPFDDLGVRRAEELGDLVPVDRRRIEAEREPAAVAVVG
jgi:hypothetical protein